MSIPSRTFRVFVSSTFSDLKAERNALQERVFPRLRELCAAHGCRFQAVDLRWGVSEEASLDQQTMRICLAEIERCRKITPRPNFIVLLGDRYGWRPLPEEIPADEFEQIERATGDGRDLALLRRWYRRDDNAAPVALYLLQPRRAPADNDAADAGAARHAEAAVWAETEERLRRVLTEAVGRLGFDEDRRLKYEASATEREIEAGALVDERESDHVFCFFRTIRDLPQDETARDYIDLARRGARLVPDEEARRRLAELKERKLRARLPEHIFDYETEWTGGSVSADHIERLCEDAYESLARVIRDEIERGGRPEPHGLERAGHEAFAHARARHFTARGRDLASLRDYVSGTDTVPLVIHGESGSGKSALVARAASEAAEWAAGSVVVARFVGATPGSSDARGLLESTVREIARRYGAGETSIPRDYAGLRELLPRLAGQATAERPLILLLDALDQLPGWEDALGPVLAAEGLPTHVRLIVSMLSGEWESARRRMLAHTRALALGPMTRDEGDALLARWLEESGRTLQPAQRAALLDAFCCTGLPLHLKLAFEDARRWRSYDDAPRLGEGVGPLVESLAARLADESSHGRVLVSRALGLLGAARRGLGEDELLDLLSADPEVLADFHRRSPESPESARLPTVVWSRLYSEVEPYLAEREAAGARVLTFHHRQFAEEIGRLFLSDAETRELRHRALAEHFRRAADPRRDASWQAGAPRGLAELAFHLHARSREDGDGWELYALADDRKFRDRQFEALASLDPIVECLDFAIGISADAADAAALIKYALERSELNRTIARSFLYQLNDVARQNPELALAAASLVSDPADRLLARTVVAWVTSRSPATHPLARKLLEDIGGAADAEVAAQNIPVLLAVAREMAERGFEEASALVGLIPDCPLRRTTRDSWLRGPERVRELARALDGPARTSLSEAAVETAAAVSAFALSSYETGLVQSRPDKFEEEAADRFGFPGPAQATSYVAARMIFSGSFNGAELLLCRSLLNSQSIRTMAVHTMMTLSDALGASGERDLAGEFRDRVATRARTLARFGGSERAKREALTLISRVRGVPQGETRPWMPPHDQLLVQTLMSNLPAETTDGPLGVAMLVDEAGVLLEDSPEEAAARLRAALQKCAALADEKERRAALIAVFALARRLGDAGIENDCIERLAASSLDPRPLFDAPVVRPSEAARGLRPVFDALVTGDPAHVGVVARVLRLDEKPEKLAALVCHVCLRGGDIDLLDQALAQLVLTHADDRAALRRISRVLEEKDRVTGVASGLGFYYSDVAWTYTFLGGCALCALGVAADRLDPFAPLTALAPIAGGFLDLIVWRAAGLLERPELSRRLLLPMLGTIISMAALAIYIRFFAPEPPRQLGWTVMWPLMVVMMVSVFIYRRFFFTDFKLKGYLAAFAVGGALTACAAAASPWLAEAIGAEQLTGFQVMGALLAGFGLNLLVKHFPVRRLYRRRGVTFGGEGGERDFRLRVTRTEPFDLEVSRPLLELLWKADAALRKGDFSLARARYTAAIEEAARCASPRKYLATCHLNRGHVSRRLGEQRAAVADYQKAIELEPASFQAHHNLALILAQDLAQYDAALTAFDRSIDLNPSHVDSFSSRALVKMELDDYEGAESDLETALALSPRHADSLSNLGTLYFRVGRVREGIELFREALEANPRDPELRLNYGVALIGSGRPGEAGRVIRKDRRAVMLWVRKFGGPPPG